MTANVVGKLTPVKRAAVAGGWLSAAGPARA
jgi:hypothetical protein